MTEGRVEVLVVVPARGGSKGLPGKNLRQVAGRTLVARAVDTACAWRDVAAEHDVRIIVDTDAPAIAAEAEAAGAWVPFLREAAYARDETSTADSVCRLLDRLAAMGRTPAHLVLLQPTSPLRVLEDVIACWEAYARAGHSACTTVPIDHPCERAVRPSASGTLQWAAGMPPTAIRRQEYATSYFMNGAVYCLETAILQTTREFIHEGRTTLVPMPRLRSLDIDTEEDLQLAEAVAGLGLHLTNSQVNR